MHPALFGRVFGRRSRREEGTDFTGQDDKFAPLFRAEASENATSPLYGRPVAKLPVSWGFLTLALVAAVAIGITVLATTSYSRKESARGLLQSVGGDVQVSGIDRGVIQRVSVREGDRVKKGDVLLTVSTDRADINGNLSQVEMLANLERQEASISQRLAAISTGGNFDDTANRGQQTSLSASIKAGQADLSAAKEQYAMAQEDYSRAVPIAERGFISAYDLRRRKQAVVTTRQAVSDAEGQISSLSGQLAQARAIAAKRPFDTIRERGILEDTLADVRQRRDQYRMSRGFAVRAPVTGTITTLQASAGRIADPLHPLLSIVPAAAALKAVAYVPSRAVGFLRAGQRVRIRYDAFPFATVGAALGTVTLVSHTVLRPEEVDAAVRLEEPAYRIEVRLDRQLVTAYGENHDLLPGMALTADIVLEKRSFLHWLLQPLYAAKGVL